MWFWLVYEDGFEHNNSVTYRLSYGCNTDILPHAKSFFIRIFALVNVVKVMIRAIQLIRCLIDTLTCASIWYLKLEDDNHNVLSIQLLCRFYLRLYAKKECILNRMFRTEYKVIINILHCFTWNIRVPYQINEESKPVSVCAFVCVDRYLGIGVWPICSYSKMKFNATAAAIHIFKSILYAREIIVLHLNAHEFAEVVYR